MSEYKQATPNLYFADGFWRVQIGKDARPLKPDDFPELYKPKDCEITRSIRKAFESTELNPSEGDIQAMVGRIRIDLPRWVETENYLIDRAIQKKQSARAANPKSDDAAPCADSPADSDSGFVPNLGKQPLPDGELVRYRCDDGIQDTCPANMLDWDLENESVVSITHWLPAGKDWKRHDGEDCLPPVEYGQLVEWITKGGNVARGYIEQTTWAGNVWYRVIEEPTELPAKKCESCHRYPAVSGGLCGDCARFYQGKPIEDVIAANKAKGVEKSQSLNKVDPRPETTERPE